MLNDILKNHKVVLGSNSPRRKQFLEELGIDFTIRASDIDEAYPKTYQKEEITDYIAQAKADSIPIAGNEILITSDTIVWSENTALGKPKDRQEAYYMLKSMCEKKHEVISSVCLKSIKKQTVFHCITKVYFNDITDESLYYYIDNYKPYDKAGAYGIQEWIGLIGIEKIEGSYTNIVGLPTAELIAELTDFLKS